MRQPVEGSPQHFMFRTSHIEQNAPEKKVLYCVFQKDLAAANNGKTKYNLPTEILWNMGSFSA